MRNIARYTYINHWNITWTHGCKKKRGLPRAGWNIIIVVVVVVVIVVVVVVATLYFIASLHTSFAPLSF